jgi:hypothetical protein
MAIIPTVRCSCMEASIAFYTNVLEKIPMGTRYVSHSK